MTSFPVLIQKITKNPFKYIIYVFKNNNILVEDPQKHTRKIIENRDVNKYIRTTTEATNWYTCFKDLYIKLNNKKLIRLFPLFNEPVRYVSLTFKYHLIIYKEDNWINKSANNFKIQVFKDNDDTNNKIKNIIITTNVPLFQTYCMLDNRTLKLFIKIKNKFYRFPYGNIFSDNSMCISLDKSLFELGSENFEKIKESLLTNIIISPFNNDINRYCKHDSYSKTTLDLKTITDNVNNNKFNNTFIDILYYLSQTPLESININLFHETNEIDDINT
jgi:hypothetical protein